MSRRLKPNGEPESPHRRTRPIEAWTVVELGRWADERSAELAAHVDACTRAIAAETHPARRRWAEVELQTAHDAASTFASDVDKAKRSLAGLARLRAETGDGRDPRYRGPAVRGAVQWARDEHVAAAVAAATFLLRAGPPYAGGYLHRLAYEIAVVTRTRPTEADCRRALSARASKSALADGHPIDAARIAVADLLGKGVHVPRAMQRVGASIPGPRGQRRRPQK